MTRESRRSVWPIVAVLVLLPVLYVASIGPVVWLAGRDNLPEPLDHAAVIVYWPLNDIRGAPGEWLAAYIKLWR